MSASVMQSAVPSLADDGNVLAEQVDNFLRFTGAEPLEPNARIIAVMGLTGSGKSRFIARCTGKRVKIGHGLQSATNSLSIFRCWHQGSTVYLIDTPGFDDTNRSNPEVLKTIAHYFGVSYAAKRFIDGLVYLHRISDNRMTGTAKQNISMFKEFVGRDLLSAVVVGTTMWKKDEMEDGLRREQELLEQQTYFGDIADSGGRMLRHGPFENSNIDEVERMSALSIVSHVLKRARTRDGHLVLQIQRELIDERKLLINTAAGRALSAQVQAAREAYERELRELQTEWQKQLQQRDLEARRNYEEIERELKVKVAEKDTEARALAIDVVRMHEEEEDRVLQQIEGASEQWRLEVSLKEDALQKAQNPGLGHEHFEAGMGRERAPEIDLVDVESLRQELAQLREEFKVRHQQGEKVQRAIKLKRGGSAVMNAVATSLITGAIGLACVVS